MKRKRWKTADVDLVLASAIASELGLPLPIARTLFNRGFTNADSIDRFLNPRLSDLSDPFALPGMDAAAGRIWRAIDSDERIVVFGDYDVDGITSTALMVKVLARLGAEVKPFLPHRIDDGYGLSEETFRRCVEQCAPRLVVTVDCGTCSSEAVRAGRECGIDVVITDHHEASQAVAPAVAVINPKLAGNEQLRTLAGVGVAFKLCHALVKQGREAGRPAADEVDLREYLDLVAVGTIADIVPLLDENRILARHGLNLLNNTESTGLSALIDVCRISGPMDGYHVGFLLGPRLNAAGRLGDAQLALELLLTDDPDRARQIAMELDASNRERQHLEASILKRACDEIEQTFDPVRHYGLVVAGSDWHAGVIGIVASRIANRYHRPCAVISLDAEGGGRGSCRSIEGFNLVEHLGACASHLKGFGGHAMAAGLDIEAARLQEFRDAFCAAAAATLEGRDLSPVQNIDVPVQLADLDERLMEALDRMKPFGLGNRAPVFAAYGLRIVGQPRIVGTKHLKMKVASGGTERGAIAFGMGDRIVPEGGIDVAFHAQLNTFAGRTGIQLNIQDFRETGANAKSAEENELPVPHRP